MKIKYWFIISILLYACNNNNPTFDYSKFSNQNFKDIAIRDVSIIPMNIDTVLVNKDIFIRNGIIDNITDSKNENYKNYSIIDGKGLFLIPGLSDMHVHLPKKEKNVKDFLALYLINGITTIRSMRGQDNHLEWREKMNDSTSVFPKMYLSSPPITRRKHYSFKESQTLIRNYKNKGFDFVKILSVKNNNVFKNINKSSLINDFYFAGHFLKNINDSIFLNSNISSIEHLGGLVNIDKSLKEKRINKLIEKNISICPTTDWYYTSYGINNIEKYNQREGIEFLDKDVVKDWNERARKDQISKSKVKIELNSEIFKERLRLIKIINDRGGNIVLSPDNSGRFSVPGYGIFEEITHFKDAGLDNYDILRSMTVNVSKLLKNDSFGTIEKGKDANFLLLGSNPLLDVMNLKKIEGIYINKIYLDKISIDEIKKSLIDNE